MQRLQRMGEMVTFVLKTLLLRMSMLCATCWDTIMLGLCHFLVPIHCIFTALYHDINLIARRRKQQNSSKSTQTKV